LTLFLLALGLLLAGGIAALASSRNPARALALATVSGVLGSAVGVVSAVAALANGGEQTLTLPWSALNASFAIGLDPLTAFFELALFAVAIPAVLFGGTYMRPHLRRRSLPAFLFFQNALLVTIALVFAARQAVLFLVAWEGMALASFFLVTFEHDQAEVRSAGLVYLVASHLGTAFLFGLFALLAGAAGSFDFSSFAAAARGAGPGMALILLSLGVLGFGTKAGLVPLHVWLPEAHPAAPSHVSALLSAVMIKTGLYGILRVLLWLPPPPTAVGLVLAGIGLLGAAGAVMLALGQRDVKRVLAYSSVENVGLVLLAMGLALAAQAHGHPRLAAVAWGAALLHVWNHAAMKGLAFMGVGALAHGAGTRDLERMGGLLRALPITGGLLLVALAALAALPPLSGFASEWLIYVGLLRAAVASPGALSLLAWIAVAALAFVGGVAAIVFARVGGIALLGAPRSDEAARAHEGGPGLWAPLAVLAGAVGLLGLFPDLALRFALPAIAQVAGQPVAVVNVALQPAIDSMAGPLRIGALFLLAAGGLLAVAARRARARVPVEESETWGCGFSRPTARMQYTATSFAQAFLSGVGPRAFQPRGRLTPPRGVLPQAASIRFETSDPARSQLFDPVFRAIGDRASRLRRYQADRLNLQLVYTVATLLALALFLVLHA
jgi:formate hydrogenlyase subunit 3/multisubunit Na+/H+ antiporter MnhD subunit